MTSPAMRRRAAAKSGMEGVMARYSPPRSGMAQPFRVSIALTLHQRQIGLLQLLGDRPALPRPDRPVVDLADRRDFRRGAGEEGLVRHVDLVARDAPLDHRDTEIARQLHHRATR